MESNTAMKEAFVGLEYIAEEVYFKERVANGYVEAYKGTTKKWQVLDEDVFDRDQIEKIQAACDAPMPDQLEAWQKKHDKVIQAPYNNENVLSGEMTQTISIPALISIHARSRPKGSRTSSSSTRLMMLLDNSLNNPQIE